MMSEHAEPHTLSRPLVEAFLPGRSALSFCRDPLYPALWMVPLLLIPVRVLSHDPDLRGKHGAGLHWTYWQE